MVNLNEFWWDIVIVSQIGAPTVIHISKDWNVKVENPQTEAKTTNHVTMKGINFSADGQSIYCTAKMHKMRVPSVLILKTR